MRLPFKVDLSEKTAVVTGGSGTLCSAMAWGLAKNGAKVALIGRNPDKINKVVDSMRSEGLEVSGYCCDVTDKEALVKTYSQIKEELGTCDILINGAGGNKPGAISPIERLGKEFKPEDMSFMELTRENVQDVMEINYLGTFLPIQVFAEDMIRNRKGSIINIASCAGILPLSKVVTYANAKSAIVSLTQWLSTYLGESGVRCNAIAPGFYAAEQNHALLYNEDGTLTKRAADIIRETPMGRFGKPEDLIGPALFLASDEASGFVNGVVLSVDGGFCACPGV